MSINIIIPSYPLPLRSYSLPYGEFYASMQNYRRMDKHTDD